ncbi:lipase [Epithele typhae]|uniref:lipase n=1 Tax=Epithele typhae TaxID=378194 RepID=UPI002007D3EB|nr:lipase [Epithele typhae]KAH9940803.1 lipase [Epithele typhae]
MLFPPRVRRVATLLALLFAAAAAAPPALGAAVRPLPRGDAPITPLTSAEVAAFAPYTHFASTAYCSPDTTRTWTCGANCDANPTFEPVASGGDGAITQFWYVGFDPALGEVIVGHQGTDIEAIIPVLTDADIVLTPLSPTLFPGVGLDVLVHNGFEGTHARSAPLVLKAVTSALQQFGATKVTVVGHSLGAAISLLDTVFLPLHLPSNVTTRFVGYGLPRVGNKAFANLVDGLGESVTHIGNMEDIVPVIPPIAFGFHQPTGEIHIMDNGQWVSCPGQDNPSPECAFASANVLHFNVSDHDGPYDGIEIGC